jgi:hypothetical protein
MVTKIMYMTLMVSNGVAMKKNQTRMGIIKIFTKFTKIKDNNLLKRMCLSPEISHII